MYTCLNLLKKDDYTFHVICNSNGKQKLIGELKIRDNGVWLISGISRTQNHVPCNELHTIFSTKQGFSRGKLAAMQVNIKIKYGRQKLSK